MATPYRPSNSGNYWIRKRVPQELRPIIGKLEIKRSLRTPDPKEAKLRAPTVLAEIELELANARRSLTMGAEEVNSLVGEYWRDRTEAIIREARKEYWSPEDLAYFRDTLAEIPEATPPQRLDDEAYSEYRDTVAAQWGLNAAQPILKRYGINPPPAIAFRLGGQIFRAERAAYDAAIAQISADPDFTPPSYASARLESTLTLPELFTEYAKAANLAPRTEDGWRTYINRAHNFLKGKRAGAITKQDIWAFAEALQRGDREANPKGRALTAKSINDNYLTSLSALFSWAMKRDLLSGDPTGGVRVKARTSESRPVQAYTREQVAAILKSTRLPQGQRVKPETANIRRWAPWLCAFTGARISEILWLRKRDIQQTQGVFFIDIYADSTGARRVKNTNSMRCTPLHPAIINEGFLDYWKSLPDEEEFLFPGNWSDKHGDRAKIPANKLGDWIKKQLPDADWSRLSPNHSFRHWLVSECRTAKIDGDRQRVITGHGHKDVHGRYGAADVHTLYNDIKAIESPLPPKQQKNNR
ncbi:DUF6538 domain-containing protein [Marinobacter sp. NSM]|uniref:DUF6538 domain-containing protein n=1 Tax=Marinobacter sp. NSM TaxID=3458004 RepID=UPI004036D559